MHLFSYSERNHLINNHIDISGKNKKAGKEKINAELRSNMATSRMRQQITAGSREQIEVYPKREKSSRRYNIPSSHTTVRTVRYTAVTKSQCVPFRIHPLDMCSLLFWQVIVNPLAHLTVSCKRPVSLSGICNFQGLLMPNFAILGKECVSRSRPPVSSEYQASYSVP